MSASRRDRSEERSRQRSRIPRAKDLFVAPLNKQHDDKFDKEFVEELVRDLRAQGSELAPRADESRAAWEQRMERHFRRPEVQEEVTQAFAARIAELQAVIEECTPVADATAQVAAPDVDAAPSAPATSDRAAPAAAATSEPPAHIALSATSPTAARVAGERSAGGAPPVPAAELPHALYDGRPYFLPGGEEFDEWPVELQRAIVDVIGPAYQELVLDARPGLAQSTGVTIVHLLWLETLEHVKLARLGHGIVEKDPNDPQGIKAMLAELDGPPRESREALIERNLRIVTTKIKACEFLVKLQQFKAQWPRVESYDEGGCRNVGGYIDGPAAPLTEHERQLRREGFRHGRAG